MKLRKTILVTSGVGTTGSQGWAWRTGDGGVELIRVIDGGSLDEGSELGKKKNRHM